MKNLLLIAVLVLSTGCLVKKQPTGRKNPSIDKEFNVYIQSFVKRGAIFGRNYNTSNMTVRFNSALSGTSTLGQCYMPIRNFDGIVEMNPSFWNDPKTSYAERQYVMDHELGHCLLLRDHKSSLIPTVDGSQINSSIMNAMFGGEISYLNNYDAYTEELFTGTNSKYAYYETPLVATTFDPLYYSNTALTASTVKVYKTAIADLESDTQALENDESENADYSNMYKNIEGFSCDDH